MSGNSFLRISLRVLALFCLCLILSGTTAQAAVMSGATYRGTFIGDRYGSFVLEVDRDGYISGELFFNKTTTAVQLVGNCLSDVECQFSALEGKMVFRGHLDQFNRFIGKWSLDSGEGRGSFYGMKQ